jgi:hypothetical protein
LLSKQIVRVSSAQAAAKILHLPNNIRIILATTGRRIKDSHSLATWSMASDTKSKMSSASFGISLCQRRRYTNQRKNQNNCRYKKYSHEHPYNKKNPL